VANDIQGLDAVNAALRNLTKVAPQAARRAMSHCGLIAVRKSKANAPRSPTMKQHSATLKRKKRTARRMLPGGLEKSIEYEATETGCSVFVASNSQAGRYARRIHDEKGVTWRNRGPGTIAKGARADEKFIERAIKDNVQNFGLIVDDELRKALPK
jgi:hypothetical protein